MDKRLKISNLVVQKTKIQMTLKPLIQVREIIENALNCTAKLNKSFYKFFTEAMQLYLTIQGHVNFTQMARFGHSSEGRFRLNFKKMFDWMAYNKSFVHGGVNRLWAVAIDPSYVNKSGRCTPGLSYFWSGCAGAMKRGLEILGIALVDGNSTDSFFLEAVQTFVDPLRGRKPKCTQGMKDPDSLIGLYLRTLAKRAKSLLGLSSIIVADAYFSKKSFADGVISLGFSLVSRFRDDVRLNYLYTGPKTHRRGRPQKFSGRVNTKELDMTVFNTMHIADGNKVTDAFWADVWSVSLERTVRVVILDCIEDAKKTQKRKVFFSTDTSLEPMDIINIYTSRFQIEFLFRDSKQFLGLTHCQARSKEALNFAFNMSLTSINVAREFARQNKMDLSIGSIKTLLHNAAMLERFISTFGKTPNIKLNNTYFKELLFYGVRNAA